MSMFVGLWSRGVVAQTVTSRPSGTAKRLAGTRVGGAAASPAWRLRGNGSATRPAVMIPAIVRESGEVGRMGRWMTQGGRGQRLGRGIFHASPAASSLHISSLIRNAVKRAEARTHGPKGHQFGAPLAQRPAPPCERSDSVLFMPRGSRCRAEFRNVERK